MSLRRAIFLRKGKKGMKKVKVQPKLIAGFDIAEHKLTTISGYDDCIIGVVERCSTPPIVCYDKEKVLKKLMKDGMTYVEAADFFDTNQLEAYMGSTTPCFLTRD